jgi:prepilin-type N-terminal cleavage/methylation domain-containing protein
MRVRGQDDGFTLIELMMAVSILGVLIAIVIPTVLGFRASAQDRRAHSDLRNVLLAEKMYWLENSVYTDTEAEIEALRPGSPIDADPEVGVFLDVNDADATTVCLVRTSESGNTFSIWDDVSAGTHYGDTDLSGADCPAAAPPGYTQDGF